jgi:hypothetical protein
VRIFPSFCRDSTNTSDTAQKNKATSYHLGLLKAKLAKLRRELIAPPGGGGGGGGLGFDVARTGIGVGCAPCLLSVIDMTYVSIRWICR